MSLNRFILKKALLETTLKGSLGKSWKDEHRSQVALDKQED